MMTKPAQSHYSEDLYVRLGLPAHPQGKQCTSSQIKKAYYQLALQHHPDKLPSHATAEQKQEATQLFQHIHAAYTVLSDEQRRAAYDRTGTLSESDSVPWSSELSAKVTLADLEAFAREYKGSEEERQHVLEAYSRVRGNMDRVLEQVMLAEVEEEERYRAIIQAALDANLVPSFASFQRTNTAKAQQKRKRNAQKEAEEAREWAQELGLPDSKSGDSDNSALVALIQKRSQGRLDSLLEQLESKYVKSAKPARSSAAKKSKSTAKPKEKQ